MSTASMIAVNWGTPTPAIIRVVQLAPAPIPTFTPSTPASINAFAPSPVATFPAITARFEYDFLIFAMEFNTPWE